MTPTIAAARTMYRSAGQISTAKTAEDKTKAYLNFAFKFAMLSTAQGALAEILAGRGPEGDDDYISWATYKILEFWAMGTPAIMKDFLEGAARMATGIDEKTNVKFSPPGFAMVDQLITAQRENAKLLEGKGNPEKAFRENMRALFYVGNIPQQLGILGYNLQDFFRNGGELEFKDLIKMRPAPK